MKATLNEVSRDLEQWPAERTSQELNGFQGILFGVVTGGLLWLGIVWFVFSLF